MRNIFIATLIASAFPGSTFAACFLGDYSMPAEYQRSEAVISGVVTDAHLVRDKQDPGSFSGIVYTVEISRSFRGSLHAKVNIYSENSSGRFPMELGTEYVLFLSRQGRTLVADNCGNSAPYDKPIVAALEKLGRR